MLSLSACSFSQPAKEPVTISVGSEQVDNAVYNSGKDKLAEYLENNTVWFNSIEYEGLPVLRLNTVDGPVFVTIEPEVLTKFIGQPL